MNARRLSRQGFTLIEIMIVVAIMAVCLGIGIPTIFRSARKDPLQQAVWDIIEACSNARSQAILRGEPYDLVIRAAGGAISVVKSPAPPSKKRGLDLNPAFSADGGAPIAGAGGASPAAAPPPFSASLHEDIIVEILFVNLRDQMDAEESRVRFYPNSLCDELRIVLNWRQQKRTMITLDPITAIADREILQ